MERTEEIWQLQTVLTDASGREWLVSTVRLRFADPRRFETIVFRIKNDEPAWSRDDTQMQYNTKEEACMGHWEMVKKVRKWKK